jgi:malate dehydrogenase (oxaloacetate-decarboxylating)(NADP+)
MICGTYGMHGLHLKFIETVLGRQKGVRNFYTMNLLTLPGRTVFLCDTYVNYDPTPEQVVEMTRLAADEVRRFGIQPRIALLSHSSFGTDNSPTAEKMRKALVMLHTEHPELTWKARCTATRPWTRHPHADLPQRQDAEDANLLIFPTLDAANIAFNLLKTAAGDGMTIGPILLGSAKPVHILTPTATVRRIVNMTALTVVEAGR